MLIYVEKPLEEIRVEKPIGDHQLVFQPLERNREK